LAIAIVSEHNQDPSQPITAKVAGDGSIYMPEIGKVEIGGLETELAQNRIATALISNRISSQPTVTIATTLQGTYHVSVAGAVARPGTLELQSGSSDLFTALRTAGGLSDNAGTKVEIRHRKDMLVAADAAAPRTNKQVDNNVQLASLTENSQSESVGLPDRVTIDLSESIIGTVKNRTLDDGDTITVLAGEKRTFRMEGLNSTPADIELKTAKDTRILDAVELAGGKVSQLADLVFIIRRLPKMEEPIIIELSLARAKQDEDENLRIAAGDIVLVRRTMRSMIGGIFHASASP
jgi:protein involved in polysaccharide export with SLBB domain